MWVVETEMREMDKIKFWSELARVFHTQPDSSTAQVFHIKVLTWDPELHIDMVPVLCFKDKAQNGRIRI